jgi:hypothetical protein
MAMADALGIPQHKPYTTPYLSLTDMELESLIDDYENTKRIK